MAAASTEGSSSTQAQQETLRRAVSNAEDENEPYEFDYSAVDKSSITPEIPYDATLEHDGKRSLSSIGLQAFFLGNTFSLGSVFTIQYLLQDNLAWRLFAFVTCLALFHFLEYWTTARFNLPTLRANSFLLFTNGRAYNIAYSLAMLEICTSSFVLPDYARWMTGHWTKMLGLFLVVLGQVVRSTAMAQAGTNFNHIPQKTRRDGHVLVTSGIYSWLRHPSYFGFFYWALGTQLLVGNKLCVIGYAVVLWGFFHRRIKGKSFKLSTRHTLLMMRTAEERLLIEFFGGDYVRYRSSTSTGIPFVR